MAKKRRNPSHTYRTESSFRKALAKYTASGELVDWYGTDYGWVIRTKKVLKTNSKPYIQRPQDQRKAGVMAGRSGDYKTGAQAWADYYKYLFENFGRKTFLAGFKSGKSKKERPNPRGASNTTLPAHVRINPRTGKTQVFVTPKVAEKLRGVKGLRVAGNPTVSPSRVPVKIKYLIVTEHGKTFKATNKSEVNRMKAVLKNQGTKFKVTTLPKGSTTWNT